MSTEQQKIEIVLADRERGGAAGTEARPEARPRMMAGAAYNFLMLCKALRAYPGEPEGKRGLHNIELYVADPPE